MSLDRSIRFCHVGGLESHIRCLKEMVVFPMLYREVFEKFHIQPPKGVLFHGPPGKVTLSNDMWKKVISCNCHSV
jgi:ATP-dependent 26S proteasome regulatory subunit